MIADSSFLIVFANTEARILFNILSFEKIPTKTDFSSQQWRTQVIFFIFVSYRGGCKSTSGKENSLKKLRVRTMYMPECFVHRAQICKRLRSPGIDSARLEIDSFAP